MKIYTDKDLTQQIVDKTFELGIVPAGEVKRFTFYVYNDSNAFLRNLEFVVKHPEVEIVEAPETLTAQTVGELIIMWSPSVTLREGLKTIVRIRGEELWS